MNMVNMIGNIYKDWRDADNISKEKYDKSGGMDEELKYVKYYESIEVRENYVLYESFYGRGMTDNPYAIFLELFTDPQYSQMQHFWVLENFEENEQVIEKYSSYKNVHFIKIKSDEYMRALSECKYLINNSTFPAYFIKKENQVYINTWHGTPLKNMGYERGNGSIESANTVRNFLQADYLLSTNEILTRMYTVSYKMEGIFQGEILQEGYPRNDRLVKTKKNEIIQTLEDNGINIEKGKKIILYAPTWRASNNGGERINPEELLNVKKVLEQKIDNDKYQILIKPHYFVYRHLNKMEEYKGLLLPSTIDTNEILSIVDVLISDYSSIFMDYMVLNRPILFYVPDLQEYIDSRGIQIPIDQLPGPVSDNLEELANNLCNIEDIQMKYKDAYAKMRQEVCYHDDGNASKRIVDIIFSHNLKSYNGFNTLNNKKKLLISSSSILENGITNSFISLLEQIDYNEWDVTAYVTVNRKDKRLVEKLNNINPNARVVVRCGRFLATRNENTLKEFCTTRGLYSSVWNKLYPWNTIRREFRRNFGNAKFDYAVDFSGYSTLYTPLIACADVKKKSIWLHNDIKADMNRIVNGEKTMYRPLHFTVSVYPKFDHIVSCSKSVMEVNKEKLGTSETYDKYTYASNSIDKNRIEEGLNTESIIMQDGDEYLVTTLVTENTGAKKLYVVKLPKVNDINFVTMGRMSTEKNHLALIRAFSRFHREHKKSHLFIIGDGPLREKIEKEIHDLLLDDDVTLTGNIDNPFAVMKRCSCFILPSIYEGQPMVLMEARACRLPIIVSDFSTVKDSLIPNGQLLIKSDEESIYQGLCAFERGEVPVADFDIDQNNKKAYQEFIQAIT